eukprot:gene15360-23486_t
MDTLLLHKDNALLLKQLSSGGVSESDWRRWEDEAQRALREEGGPSDEEWLHSAAPAEPAAEADEASLRAARAAVRALDAAARDAGGPPAPQVGRQWLNCCQDIPDALAAVLHEDADGEPPTGTWYQSLARACLDSMDRAFAPLATESDVAAAVFLTNAAAYPLTQPGGRAGSLPSALGRLAGEICSAAEKALVLAFQPAVDARAKKLAAAPPPPPGAGHRRACCAALRWLELLLLRGSCGPFAAAVLQRAACLRAFATVLRLVGVAFGGELGDRPRGRWAGLGAKKDSSAGLPTRTGSMRRGSDKEAFVELKTLVSDEVFSQSVDLAARGLSLVDAYLTAGARCMAADDYQVSPEGVARQVLVSREQPPEALKTLLPLDNFSGHLPLRRGGSLSHSVSSTLSPANPPLSPRSKGLAAQPAYHPLFPPSPNATGHAKNLSFLCEALFPAPRALPPATARGLVSVLAGSLDGFTAALAKGGMPHSRQGWNARGIAERATAYREEAEQGLVGAMMPDVAGAVGVSLVLRVLSAVCEGGGGIIAGWLVDQGAGPGLARVLEEAASNGWAGENDLEMSRSKAGDSPATSAGDEGGLTPRNVSSTGIDIPIVQIPSTGGFDFPCLTNSLPSSVHHWKPVVSSACECLAQIVACRSEKITAQLLAETAGFRAAFDAIGSVSQEKSLPPPRTPRFEGEITLVTPLHALATPRFQSQASVLTAEPPAPQAAGQPGRAEKAGAGADLLRIAAFVARLFSEPAIVSCVDTAASTGALVELVKCINVYSGGHAEPDAADHRMDSKLRKLTTDKCLLSSISTVPISLSTPATPHLMMRQPSMMSATPSSLDLTFSSSFNTTLNFNKDTSRNDLSASPRPAAQLNGPFNSHFASLLLLPLLTSICALPPSTEPDAHGREGGLFLSAVRDCFPQKKRKANGRELRTAPAASAQPSEKDVVVGKVLCATVYALRKVVLSGLRELYDKKRQGGHRGGQREMGFGNRRDEKGSVSVGTVQEVHRCLMRLLHVVGEGATSVQRDVLGLVFDTLFRLHTLACNLPGGVPDNFFAELLSGFPFSLCPLWLATPGLLPPASHLLLHMIDLSSGDAEEQCSNILNNIAQNVPIYTIIANVYQEAPEVREKAVRWASTMTAFDENLDSILHARLSSIKRIRIEYLQYISSSLRSFAPAADTPADQLELFESAVQQWLAASEAHAAAALLTEEAYLKTLFASVQPGGAAWNSFFNSEIKAVAARPPPSKLKRTPTARHDSLNSEGDGDPTQFLSSIVPSHESFVYPKDAISDLFFTKKSERATQRADVALLSREMDFDREVLGSTTSEGETYGLSNTVMSAGGKGWGRRRNSVGAGVPAAVPGLPVALTGAQSLANRLITERSPIACFQLDLLGPRAAPTMFQTTKATSFHPVRKRLLTSKRGGPNPGGGAAPNAPWCVQAVFFSELTPYYSPPAPRDPSLWELPLANYRASLRQLRAGHERLLVTLRVGIAGTLSDAMQKEKAIDSTSAAAEVLRRFEGAGLVDGWEREQVAKLAASQREAADAVRRELRACEDRKAAEIGRFLDGCEGEELHARKQALAAKETVQPGSPTAREAKGRARRYRAIVGNKIAMSNVSERINTKELQQCAEELARDAVLELHRGATRAVGLHSASCRAPTHLKAHRNTLLAWRKQRAGHVAAALRHVESSATPSPSSSAAQQSLAAAADLLMSADGRSAPASDPSAEEHIASLRRVEAAMHDAVFPFELTVVTQQKLAGFQSVLNALADRVHPEGPGMEPDPEFPGLARVLPRVEDFFKKYSVFTKARRVRLVEAMVATRGYDHCGLDEGTDTLWKASVAATLEQHQKDVDALVSTFSSMLDEILEEDCDISDAFLEHTENELNQYLQRELACDRTEWRLESLAYSRHIAAGNHLVFYPSKPSGKAHRAEGLLHTSARLTGRILAWEVFKPLFDGRALLKQRRLLREAARKTYTDGQLAGRRAVAVGGDARKEADAFAEREVQFLDGLEAPEETASRRREEMLGLVEDAALGLRGGCGDAVGDALKEDAVRFLRGVVAEEADIHRGIAAIRLEYITRPSVRSSIGPLEAISLLSSIYAPHLAAQTLLGLSHSVLHGHPDTQSTPPPAILGTPHLLDFCFDKAAVAAKEKRVELELRELCWQLAVATTSLGVLVSAPSEDQQLRMLEQYKIKVEEDELAACKACEAEADEMLKSEDTKAKEELEKQLDAVVADRVRLQRRSKGQTQEIVEALRKVFATGVNDELADDMAEQYNAASDMVASLPPATSAKPLEELDRDLQKQQEAYEVKAQAAEKAAEAAIATLEAQHREEKIAEKLAELSGREVQLRQKIAALDGFDGGAAADGGDLGQDDQLKRQILSSEGRRRNRAIDQARGEAAKKHARHQEKLAELTSKMERALRAVRASRDVDGTLDAAGESDEDTGLHRAHEEEKQYLNRRKRFRAHTTVLLNSAPPRLSIKASKPGAEEASPTSSPTAAGKLPKRVDGQAAKRKSIDDGADPKSRRPSLQRVQTSPEELASTSRRASVVEQKLKRRQSLQLQQRDASFGVLLLARLETLGTDTTGDAGDAVGGSLGSHAELREGKLMYRVDEINKELKQRSAARTARQISEKKAYEQKRAVYNKAVRHGRHLPSSKSIQDLHELEVRHHVERLKESDEVASLEKQMHDALHSNAKAPSAEQPADNELAMQQPRPADGDALAPKEVPPASQADSVSAPKQALPQVAYRARRYATFAPDGEWMYNLEELDKEYRDRQRRKDEKEKQRKVERETVVRAAKEASCAAAVELHQAVRAELVDE